MGQDCHWLSPLYQVELPLGNVIAWHKGFLYRSLPLSPTQRRMLLSFTVTVTVTVVVVVVVVVIVLVVGPRPVCDATFLCTSHV